MKLLLVILLLLPVTSFSQKEKTKGINLYTITSAGASGGESGIKPIFQLSSGVKFNRYVAGAGVAYDLYGFNSVPVFADWRMNFGNRKTLFLYANGGYNIPDDRKQEDNDLFKTGDKWKGGLYMDAGIGYRIRIGGLHHISFSAGYSQKNMIWQKTYAYPCFFPPCNEEINNYHYNLNRLVTRLSWELGK
jgi:hypothetical protein